MGQKTNPIGIRLGIIRGWDSNWYGGNNYGDKIAEDYKIRKYIHARLAKASVSNVIIERTLKLIGKPMIHASMERWYHQSLLAFLASLPTKPIEPWLEHD